MPITYKYIHTCMSINYTGKRSYVPYRLLKYLLMQTIFMYIDKKKQSVKNT